MLMNYYIYNHLKLIFKNIYQKKKEIESNKKN